MTSHETSSVTRVQFAMLRVSIGRTYGSSAMYLQSDQRHTEREPRGWYVVCGMWGSACEARRKFEWGSCAWCLFWLLVSDASVCAVPLGPFVPDFMCFLGTLPSQKHRNCTYTSAETQIKHHAGCWGWSLWVLRSLRAIGKMVHYIGI